MNNKTAQYDRSTSVTVIIHSYQSARDITECIESAKYLTPHIHVIDMGSTDGTVELAKMAGAVVYTVPRYSYVEPVREKGIRTAKTPWVFLLDTDERITPQLARALHDELKQTPATCGAFQVARKNIFARDVWLKHGAWWPDYQTRVISLTHFTSWPMQIHSTPILTGDISRISEPILHYFHGDLAAMAEKTIIYENIEADLLYKAGKHVSVSLFFRKFFGELYRRLIRGRGFMDGNVGIIESLYQAFSKTITYIYLYEKKQKSSVV